MKINTIINIECQDWKSTINQLDLQKIVETSFTAINKQQKKILDKKKQIEIAVTATNNQNIQQLNLEHRNKNKPTNVLALSYCTLDDLPPHPIIQLGDIIIAYEYITAEAKEKEINITDHTAHMLVHATLHLLGFDHKQAKEVLIMENNEKKILKKLNLGCNF